MCFLEKTYEWIPELKNAPEEFLTLCTQISEFLKNDERRFNCFHSLNKEMLKQLNGQKLDIVNNHGRLDEIIKAVKDPDNRNPDIKKITTHLLSDVLSANEAKFNFSLCSKSGRPHGQAVTYLAFIEPDLFREQLRKGRQWKDPTVPGAHGEFTHRIQWYMITTTLQPPGAGWSAFYQWIGTIKHVSDAKLASKMITSSAKSIFKETKGFKECEAQDKEDWWNLGFWDALVDRNPSSKPYEFGPYNTDDEQDFRAPENLAPYLEKKVQGCDLLQAFLEGRAKKRTSRNGHPITPTGNYLARKLYNLPLINLDEKRQDILALLLALEDSCGAGSGWSVLGRSPVFEPILKSSVENKVSIQDQIKGTKQVFTENYCKYYTGISNGDLSKDSLVNDLKASL